MTTMPLPLGSVRPTRYVFDRAPMLVYWEMTRACPLACRHCRAEAVAQRSDRELTTAEGERLFDQIAAFGRPYPHVVLTGGDPLRRDDLVTLVRAATARGVGTSVSPSATDDLTPELLAELKASAVQSMSLSLDGSTAALHDGFRGVPGTFASTQRAARAIRAAGIPLQVNTLVTDETADDLPAIHGLLRGLDIMRWSLFFLIGVGRGAVLGEVSPVRSERLFRWLLDLEGTSPFPIKTTEAMHYRRVAIARMERAGMDRDAIEKTPVGRGFGVRDGNGIVFVAHDGAIHPSGFLPIPCGDVRSASLVDVYRAHPLFVALRDARSFAGKCGRCPYAAICGGSRARAFARTGDALASDPLCPYVPPADAVAWESRPS
ncbi:MAG: TIGR04053 family radical SAM/SPASM domain-containing protein [Chloroflexota bacterium]|nr:TIGR04053 family radical SAM/SPASM domain-containing protein [Chloroflexota bacterium]MDE3192557.1 TIGR04053 family radical SAM/SPASM domain-containing protein [Chloroflexota bacterium]